MATITFDSLRVADKTAGFTDLVTVKDLDASLSPLKTDLAVLKSEVGQMKWMLGFVIGGIIAVLAKLLSQ